jgi:hypothetical protein
VISCGDPKWVSTLFSPRWNMDEKTFKIVIDSSPYKSN